MTPLTLPQALGGALILGFTLRNLLPENQGSDELFRGSRYDNRLSGLLQGNGLRAVPPPSGPLRFPAWQAAGQGPYSHKITSSKKELSHMRKTKIICTIGPSSENRETLIRMCQAGMNVARLNFSHGSYAEHQAKIDLIKQVRQELGMPIAIMLDTKGPEYRIRTFKEG